MKSKMLISLLLATSISSGFADVSTLAQRDAMVKEAFAKSPEEALKIINNQQQDGAIKTDDRDYVVVVKKLSDDSYMRVAHSKKDKVDKVVEPVLVDVMRKAEEKLTGGNGPVDMEISSGGSNLYAVVEKQGDYLIFNICPAKDEVEGFLKANPKKTTITSTEKVSPTPPAEPKKEELKETKKEDKPAPSIVNALASASITSSSTEEKIHSNGVEITAAEAKTEDKPVADSTKESKPVESTDTQQKVHS